MFTMIRETCEELAHQVANHNGTGLISAELLHYVSQSVLMQNAITNHRRKSLINNTPVFSTVSFVLSLIEQFGRSAV